MQRAVALVLLTTLTISGCQHKAQEPSYTPKPLKFTDDGRIVNELERMQGEAINPLEVKRAEFVFLGDDSDPDHAIRYETSSPAEIRAIIHAIRGSSREGLAATPGAELQPLDELNLYMKQGGEPKSWRMLGSHVPAQWGPEMAAIHKRYRVLAAKKQG